MANGDSSLLTKIVSAVLVTVTLSGGVWVGTIQTRLAQAEEDISKSEDDHDTIVRMDTEQQQIKKDVSEVKTTANQINAKLSALLAIEAAKRGNTNAEGDTN